MSEPLSPLPPKPQPPQNYDCCGGGCADCDLRIYQRELARWKKLEAAFLAAGRDPGATTRIPLPPAGEGSCVDLK